MAINLHCPKCKSSSSLKSRNCKKCGHDLSKGKRYRVVVKYHNGRRIMLTLIMVGSVYWIPKVEKIINCR
jgi:hypothetical protein